MADIRGWLTTAEAARLTGYNLEYIRRLVRTKKVRAEKWGRDWMISRASIKGYSEQEPLRGPRPKQKGT